MPMKGIRSCYAKEVIEFISYFLFKFFNTAAFTP